MNRGGPRVPAEVTILIGLFRFACGFGLGLVVAFLFSLKAGAIPKPLVLGIGAFFGVLAVALWRWFEIIVNETLRPTNWQ